MTVIKNMESIQFLSETDKTILAEVTFEKKDDALIIRKTFVDPSQRGKGFASLLMKEALLFAKENQLFLSAECSYAKSYFEKNTDPIFKETV